MTARKRKRPADPNDLRGSYRCSKCRELSPYRDTVDGNFRTCPKCGDSFRVSFGKEFSAAMDAYAEGAISADELVQAGIDQEFADITREDGG